jgi:hypothetical protein
MAFVNATNDGRTKVPCLTIASKIERDYGAHGGLLC